MPLQRALAKPGFACGDSLDINYRPIQRDKFFEQPEGVLQVLDEFFAILLGILTEHGQGALVLAGGQLLKLDVVLFQYPVEVGDLGQDTDGANHSKGRRDNFVRHAGHHIATACCYFIH